MGWFYLPRRKLVVPPETRPAEDAYISALGIDPEKGTTSFDQRVRKQYRLHTLQYWFVASSANGLLCIQIILGAALTALGATRTNAAQTAVIYLGAASTITAGLLTYFKSRNQPSRARHLRQALRAVRNNMDDQSRELAGLTPEQAREAASKIIKQYNDALAEAVANEPDLWMSLGDLRRFIPQADATREGVDEAEWKAAGAKDAAGGGGMNASSTSGVKPEKQDGHVMSSGPRVETGVDAILPSAQPVKQAEGA